MATTNMKIEKSTYIRRRAQLKKDMGSGLLLFLGNDEVGMNYADNTYPFRQDSTLLYFFGLDYAGLAAVIDVDEDREIVFGNELTIDDIVWTGTQPSLKDKCSEIGISDTMPMKELKNYIDKARAKGQTIHFLPPYRGDHKVWLWELLGVEPAAQTAKASVPFIKAIVAQRNYKDEEEIRLIEESVDLSTEMHLAAYRTVRQVFMNRRWLLLWKKWLVVMAMRWPSRRLLPLRDRCSITTDSSTS